MVANLKATGTTNPEPKTCVDAQCSCEIIWSLAQQFAMRQIVTHAPAHNHMLDYREGDPHASSTQIDKATPAFVSNYAVRARRIAAAYARVYLEDFHLGDKSKIGRFYWLGLGAFAAKQVAVTLELKQVRVGNTFYNTDLYEGLGQGNLWLFNDVLPWFYGYAAGSDTFDRCAPSRNSKNFVDQVENNLTRQKGYRDSIDKIPYEIDGDTGAKKSKLGYLKCTQIVRDGFKMVAEWESADEIHRPDKALKHLILIAQHEQGEVLQGLIYDNPDFASWIKTQRLTLATSDDTSMQEQYEVLPWNNSTEYGADMLRAKVVRALVPNLQLVLTSGDTTDNLEFRSDATDRLVLEDYRKRMTWINDVAKKYHGLMRGNHREDMRGYLEDIKSWGDLPDKQ